MKVLLTGAFGNIGRSALHELLLQGHTVRCFDVRTPANRKLATLFRGQIEVMWGDLRSLGEVTAAVEGQEAVVHLAFVIPTLSATGFGSEERPDWARSINVGGTLNLLTAVRASSLAPKLIFASSLHVFGLTQHLDPPRTAADPVRPVENYALHKVTCEEMIKSSGVTWTILRLAASMPVRLILDPGLFDVPLSNRIEFVHARDVGLAIGNALQTDAVWGHTWLIGGGPRCQHYYREVATRVLEAAGVGMLPEKAFSHVPFATDWLDTARSQQMLAFQRRTLDDYVQDLRAGLGPRRGMVQLLRPVIRHWLLSKSSYYQAARGARQCPVATPI